MVHVFFYGTHTAGWMNTLGAEGQVWERMHSEVASVSFLHTPEEVHAAFQRVESAVLIPLLERHAVECPIGYPSLIPSQESLGILSDKEYFYHYAQKQGLSHFCPTHFETPEEASFPAVLKRTNLNATGGVSVVRSAEEVHSCLEQVPWNGHRWVLQEYLEGDREFVSHLVCQEGKVIWDKTFRYGDCGGLRISRPKPILEVFDTETEVLEAYERFLKPLAYSGPCNIDYKWDESGKLRIFEINPRLGGSLMRDEFVDLLRSVIRCIIQAAKLEPFEEASLSFGM